VKIETTVKVKDETPALKKSADDGTFESIGKAAGAIRKTASRSIRRSKKPSRPGSPPNTQTGLLRRAIRFDLGPDKKDVAIGPVNAYARTIWDLLEFGGKGRPRKLLRPREFKVGDYGPIQIVKAKAQARDRRGRFVRATKRRYAYTLLKNPAMVAKANRLYRIENEARAAQNARPKNYEPRPFMGPALEKMKPRLPAFWRNSVR
jgi:hypothetical protein